MRVGDATRVALVTASAHPDLTLDDRLAAAALTGAGFSPRAELWDAPTRPLEEYDAVVLRSCWDYHRRLDEFLAWLDRLERTGVPLFNSFATVRWNARKTYLRDLAAAGIPVVPTAWLSRGDGATLSGVLRDNGWRRVVVKPTVSATAFHTWQAGPDVSDQDEARFAELLRERDMMIQPSVPEIETDGELSVVFIGGRYSHAALKRAKPGDFRVQEDFGGTVETARPADDVVEEAAAALAVAPGPTLYARVDGAIIDGRLVLMELELIEPVLFFARAADAPAKFAEALRSAVGAAGEGPRLRPGAVIR